MSWSRRPSQRVVEQRVRNRLIEYLELAASFEDQTTYQAGAPMVHVPSEIINQWADWSPPELEPWQTAPSGIYTAAEWDALHAFHVVWDWVARNTPDPLPELAALQRTPEWERLRAAADAALQPFHARGRSPEDREA